MLLFDATHTSHSRAQTGIQHVCRALFAGVEERGPVTAVCYDPHLRGWRGLDGGELAQLRDRRGAGGNSRGTKWSLRHQLTGHARRLIGRRPQLPSATGLVCPELFSARLGTALPELFRSISGPRVALFHDAIGLKYPELTPPATVARLPAYLTELRQFDGVAAVSEDSAASLRDFWTWLGGDVPPVQAIPLAVDPIPIDLPPAESAVGPPRLLCVGTLEGRKNHLALLDAVETLWRAGHRFELELVGLARPDTAGPALARLRDLQAAGRPLFYRGSVSDENLHLAYQRCAFTVYPSLTEGFGLPVLESLQHGRPCVCSAQGALGESARGGGTVALASLDAPTLAAALGRLLTDPKELVRLAAAARTRRFRSWHDYTSDLARWMSDLPRRP
ncbi:MAG: glycosyltransferase family 4 protein [Opitutales bacterium]